MIDDDKRAAARAAVDEVRSGMAVGLGTGSTAAHVITLLGERVRGGLSIRAVATSIGSERLARDAGIPTLDFSRLDTVDLTIDGADEIDDRFFAIKGAGAAMMREKIVAEASSRMIVVADGTKRVARIGAAMLPVEVLPFARGFVAKRLAALGGRPNPRVAAGEPVMTDQGNVILDCHFGILADPAALASSIAEIPGVMAHGLFLREVDAAYIAANGVVTRLERNGGKG